MADNGKLYPAFDQAYVDAMVRLVSKADVVLPNLTEACFLTGTEYHENYDKAFVMSVVEKLHNLGAKCVVLTGIGFDEGMTGVLISGENGVDHYQHPRLSKSYHGTGDIYASAFVGSWIGGKTMGEAARIAADYVCQCIRNTVGDDSHWYGVKFETAIPYLVNRLYN
jgi:pyridoxine kinase